jgi:hypothetical protein
VRVSTLQRAFRSRTEEEAWYAAVEASVGRALSEERSCLVEVTEALRELADRIIAEGAECGRVHGKSTALCELHSWGKRLSIAHDARVCGANFFEFESSTLFHPRTGLRACGSRASSSDEAWGVLIRRARRQLRLMATRKTYIIKRMDTSYIPAGDDTNGRQCGITRASQKAAAAHMTPSPVRELRNRASAERAFPTEPRSRQSLTAHTGAGGIADP